MKKIDLTGQKFGRLKVIGEEGRGKDGQIRWKCKCDCGKITVVQSHHLRRGNIKSCGCLNQEVKTKHGMSSKKNKQRIYRIWESMKARCFNINHRHYNRYGGRGITICDEWKNDFQAFYDWAMSNGYQDNLTIDRINNDGDYEPENCRWVTYEEQNNNTRQNVTITLNGETHTVAEWVRITGIPRNTIIYRLKNGKSPEEILKTK